jgi:hypothetical protein
MAYNRKSLARMHFSGTDEAPADSREVFPTFKRRRRRDIARVGFPCAQLKLDGQPPTP